MVAELGVTESREARSKVTEEELAKNRYPARRASAAAAGVMIAELQALSNALAEGVAHRRAVAHRTPDRA